MSNDPMSPEEYDAMDETNPQNMAPTSNQEVPFAVLRGIATNGTCSPWWDASMLIRITQELFGRRLAEQRAADEATAYTEEAREIRESARCDLAYFDGAKQAAAMAHQSLKNMDAWIAGGCGRWTEAKRALAHPGPSIEKAFAGSSRRVEPTQPQSITINGYQAKELLEAVDDDDCCVEIAELPARKSIEGEDMEAGLYIWFTDYPEEGCLLLPKSAPEKATAPLRDSDAAFDLGVLPTEQPEKASEVRARDPHDGITVCPPESRCPECWSENGSDRTTDR